MNSQIKLFEAVEAQHILAQAVAGAIVSEESCFKNALLRSGGVVVSTDVRMGQKLNRAAGLGWKYLERSFTDGVDEDVLVEAQKDVDDIDAFFQRAGVDGAGMIYVIIDEQGSIMSPYMKGIIGDHGYEVSLEGHVDTFVRDLRMLESEGNGAEQWQYSRNELVIQLVGSEDTDLQQFVASAVEGFRSNRRGPDILQLLAQIAVERTDTELFFAFDKSGNLMGSAGMAVLHVEIDEGSSRTSVAELYIDSTLPASRGKGVHVALIHARCQRAKQLGCEWAKMDIRKDNIASSKNAVKAGFDLLYSKAEARKITPTNR